jgi:hypothetical protein
MLSLAALVKAVRNLSVFYTVAVPEQKQAALITKLF